MIITLISLSDPIFLMKDSFYTAAVLPRDADGKANSVDSDQVAGSGLFVINLSVSVFRILTVKIQS